MDCEEDLNRKKPSNTYWIQETFTAFLLTLSHILHCRSFSLNTSQALPEHSAGAIMQGYVQEESAQRMVHEPQCPVKGVKGWDFQSFTGHGGRIPKEQAAVTMNYH